jgi:transmembrane sensor
MTEPNAKSSPDDAIEAIAARWIARRDRGLTEAEQAAYLQWLREDPRHEAAMVRPEKNWSALDQLAGQIEAQGGPPNPDLLAPRRRTFWSWTPILAAAAAAAVALIYFSGAPGSGPQPARADSAGNETKGPGLIRIQPERLTLEDGSIVELNAQGKVEVQFTAAERRVRLERGEAFFTVAKNPQRPFIVITDRVTVHAVGTAFSVELGREDLSVLVTEGRVQVDESSGPPSATAAPARALSALHAGQQGNFDLVAASGKADRPKVKVTELAPAEIDRALSWRNLQLEFTDMTLGEVVAEFNRHNRQKLVVGDVKTAAVRITGTFRANNVDAFVRLLDFGFGVTAVPQGAGIVLRKTHGH